MNTNWENYQDKIQEAADKTNTSTSELDENVSSLSDSNERLEDTGLNAADALWEQVDAAQQASIDYTILASSIWETIEALQELSRVQAQIGSNWSNGIGVGSGTINTPGIGDMTLNPSGGISIIGNSIIDAEGNPVYDVDWSDLMTQAILNGYYQTAFLLGEFRDKSEHWESSESGGWRDNETVIQDALDMVVGNKEYEGYEGEYDNNEMSFEEWMRLLGIPMYATGGYTGELDNGKLAFLHEKELVLNQEDTKNILSAVAAVRSFGPELFSQIERILDGNAVSAMNVLTSKITTIQQPIPASTIEQSVKIEANFPSATDRNEIEAAFNSLVNDAAQYARRRTQ